MTHRCCRETSDRCEVRLVPRYSRAGMVDRANFAQGTVVLRSAPSFAKKVRAAADFPP